MPKQFDLEQFIPYRLHQAAERTSQQFREHYRSAYNINRTEWRTLFHIGSYGPISARDISRRSRLDATLISRAVVKLEDCDWVERKHRPGDRRGHDLVLTVAGLKVFRELQALAGRFNGKLTDALGRDASRKLLDYLAELEACAEEDLID